jgi:hypothetical protein
MDGALKRNYNVNPLSEEEEKQMRNRNSAYIHDGAAPEYASEIADDNGSAAATDDDDKDSDKDSVARSAAGSNVTNSSIVSEN